MKIRSIAIIAFALFLPVGIAACSEDSTGDLDKGELSDELQKEGLSAEEADCAAGALIDADFSREEVDKLAANDTDGVDADKVDEFTAALSECIGIPDLTTDTGN